MPLQALIHRYRVRHARGRLIDYNDIEARQFLLVLSKRLPNHPFYAVSCCRLAAMLFGNRKTEPWQFIFIIAAEHCKEFIAAARCFFEHAAESGGVE